MPNIKVTEVKRIKIQNKYPAVEVSGKNLKDGKDYSTKVFMNQEDLAKKLEALSIGDKVNLWMKKEGKYWNLQDVLPYEDDTKTDSNGKTVRGDNAQFRTPDEIIRTDAISQALTTITSAFSAADLKKMGSAGIFALAKTLADDVTVYITGIGQAEKDLTPPADLNPNADDDDDLPEPPDDV